MKRLLIITLALLGASPAFPVQDRSVRNGLTTKLGFDLAGRFEAVVAGTPRSADRRSGISMSLEHVWGGRRALSFGVGVLSQAPRRFDPDWAGGSLGVVAGYGVASVALPVRTSDIATYASVRLGWSFPMADRAFKQSLGTGASLSPDVYWALAAGVLIGPHLVLEASWNALHGEAEWTRRVDELESRHLTLSIGLQF